jgi:hypothetical protein
MMFEMSRRVVAGVAAAFLILVIAVSILWASTTGQQNGSGLEVSGGDGGFEFNVSFGASRLPKTRSVLLNLCPEDAKERGVPIYPECASPTVDSGATTQAAPPARPEITSAGVVADLQRRGDGPDAQFPASQLAVVGVNEGPQGLRITVTADPRQPERVAAGTYRGDLVVERSRGPAIHFTMAAVLDDRGGRVSLYAAIALALGAVGGALIKWLNDVYAPLAALRRRHRRLARRMRPDRPHLPLSVVRSMEDLRESIRSVDPVDVAEQLDALSQRRDEFAQFASVVRALRRELEVQRALIQQIGEGSESFATLLRREEQKIDGLLARPWPWPDTEQVWSECRTMQAAFEEVTDGLQRGETDTAEARAALVQSLSQVAASEPEIARARAERVAAESEAAARVEALDRAATDSSRNLFEVLLDNAWWLILASSAVVVAAIGYYTEFLGNDGFEDEFIEYWKLAAWAFALQLAGTTVLEAAGRLTIARSTTG